MRVGLTHFCATICLYNRNMKTIIIASTTMLSSLAFAQNPMSDKTLDINYLATYKSDFSLRWSSKLAESQNWEVRAFNTGAAYNLNRGANRFAITYDLWRGCELNAPMSQRYGMSYSSTSRLSNLSVSVFQVQIPNQPNIIQGRIDFSMKFDR